MWKNKLKEKKYISALYKWGMKSKSSYQVQLRNKLIHGHIIFPVFIYQILLLRTIIPLSKNVYCLPLHLRCHAEPQVKVKGGLGILYVYCILSKVTFLKYNLHSKGWHDGSPSVTLQVSIQFPGPPGSQTINTQEKVIHRNIWT